MLRRAGFRFISGRPVHPKADAERQREFLADFEAQVTSTLNPEALAGPIESGSRTKRASARRG